MILIFITVLLVILMIAPKLWVQYTLRKYSKPLPHMQGTGGELAEHLIERFNLEGIGVEMTTEGADHFDPNDKMVRLSPSIYEKKSLTAVAVAAHEVGHAIQFSRKEKVFKLRSRYLPLAHALQRLGGYALLAAPLVGLVLKAPLAMALPLMISIILNIIGALTYLIVLPEEWDASFGKAMPILAEGYVAEADIPKVEKVLKAAALTHFAAALSSMLNLSYLLLILRR